MARLTALHLHLLVSVNCVAPSGTKSGIAVAFASRKLCPLPQNHALGLPGLLMLLWVCIAVLCPCQSLPAAAVYTVSVSQLDCSAILCPSQSLPAVAFCTVSISQLDCSAILCPSQSLPAVAVCTVSISQLDCIAVLCPSQSLHTVAVCLSVPVGLQRYPLSQSKPSCCAGWTVSMLLLGCRRSAALLGPGGAATPLRPSMSLPTSGTEPLRQVCCLQPLHSCLSHRTGVEWHPPWYTCPSMSKRRRRRRVVTCFGSSILACCAYQ